MLRFAPLPLVALLAASPAVLVAGCLFDPVLPASARLTCERTDDCPDGLECAAAAGRCVAAGDDVDAPRIASSSLALSRTRPGQTVAGTLRASEPLARAPELEAFGAPDAELEVEWTRGDEATFVVRVADGQPDGTVTLRARLEDAAGNEGVGELGAVTVDATPPTYVDDAVLVEPVRARPGAAVLVRVPLSENVVQTPALRIGDGAVTVEGTGAEQGVLFYAFDAPDFPDASLPLSLGPLQDDVGNLSEGPHALPSLTIDSTPPSILAFEISRDTLSLQPAHSQLSVLVELAPGDESAEVTVDVDGASASCLGAGTAQRGCSFELTDAPPTPRTAVVRARAIDELGNASERVATLVLDASAPALIDATAALRITPPPGARIAAPTRATVGGTIEVSFRVDEVLARDPVLDSQATGPLSLVREQAGTYTFVGVVDEAATQGDHTVSVALEDPVGNATTVTFPFTFSVDADAPPALDVDAPDTLVLRRAPYGASELAPRGTSLAPAPPGTYEPGARVLALEPGTAAQLASGTALSDGSLPALALGLADIAAIELVQVDDAANASPPAVVRAVEWIGTLHDREPGGAFGNPIVIETGPLPRAPAVDRGVEHSGKGPAEPDDGQVVAADARFLRGVEVRPSAELPPVRYGAALAEDPVRGVVWIYGGYGAGQPLADLWRWDGLRLSRAVLSASGPTPPATTTTDMAWHADLDLLMLRTASGVWTFDGASWGLDTGSPQGEGAIVSDPTTGGVLALVCSGTCALMERSADGWSVRGDAPGNGKLVYDTARGVLVLLRTQLLSAPVEVYEWEDDAFVLRTPSTSLRPMGRVEFGAAFDASRACTLVVGGRADVFGDTQTASCWDGAAWTAAVDLPIGEARAGPALAYSARHRTVLLVGGHLGVYIGAYHDDQTAFVLPAGATSWRLAASAEGAAFMPPRTAAAVCFDEREGRLLVVGGCTDFYGFGGVYPRVDTWELRGGRWRELGELPGARFGGALLCNPGTGEIIHYGGADDGYVGLTDTWRLVGDEWVPLTPPSNPGPRLLAASVFAAGVGYPVLYGGAYAPGELWAWTGGDWQLVVDEAQGAGRRNGAALVHHEPSGGLVILGGALDYDDPTALAPMRFDGSAFVPIDTSDPEGDGDPAPRAYFGATVEPQTGDVLLYGGFPTLYSTRDDAWRFNGASFERVLVAQDAPGPQEAHALVAGDGAVWLVGGASDGLLDGRLWRLLDGDAPTVFTLRIPVGASGIEPARLDGIDVLARTTSEPLVSLWLRGAFFDNVDVGPLGEARFAVPPGGVGATADGAYVVAVRTQDTPLIVDAATVRLRGRIY